MLGNEFAEKLKQNIFKSLYDGLYDNCENNFNKIFDTLNYRITWAGDNIGQSVQEWNPSAFSLVEALSENACMPIAAVVVTLIFCWEMIHLMQESNRMQNISSDNMLMVFLKFALCLAACVRSLDIVMGVYYLGNWAAQKIAGSTAGTFGHGMTLNSVIPANPGTYEFGMIVELLGVLIVLCISLAICNICAAIIYVRINMWFIELLVYATPAAIPMATFFNKEWGQMGMNYTKKIIAVGFEGFFMLLMFALYGGIINNISSSDFTEMMTMMCGCGVGLILLLFKAGNISSSIFNAH